MHVINRHTWTYVHMSNYCLHLPHLLLNSWTQNHAELHCSSAPHVPALGIFSASMVNGARIHSLAGSLSSTYSNTFLLLPQSSLRFFSFPCCTSLASHNTSRDNCRNLFCFLNSSLWYSKTNCSARTMVSQALLLFTFQSTVLSEAGDHIGVWLWAWDYQSFELRLHN